jgi:hypothetical protein
MGFNGPNTISYQDIKAWSDLTGTPLDEREVEAIKAIDATYMRSTNG